MMIKPQIGILFVWPLFWKRHYLTIATAVTVCLCATLVASLIVHESPLDLILQIPQLGKPYGAGMLMDKIAKPILGANATFVVMGAFFTLTGFVTRLLRHKCDFFVLCVPVAVAIPLWSYCSLHDYVILLPAFLVLTGKMFSPRKLDKWKVLGVVYCAALSVSCAWSAALSVKLFDPSGIGWIYRLAGLVSQAMLVTFAVFLILEKQKKDYLWSTRTLKA